MLFGWLFVFDVFLLGVFTFIFARTITLSRPADLFSGVVLLFGGTTIRWIYTGYLSNLNTNVGFPRSLPLFSSHGRV